jgi:1-deoxy-D-xylulose-5-phosphate reductoisomerase
VTARRVILLGATGSIGRQALAVMGQLGGAFRPVALAAATNWHSLAEMADDWDVRDVALCSSQAAEDLIAARPDLAVRGGATALADLVEEVAADIVIVAVAGLAALQPMLAALQRGLRVAFASKEPMVAAGRMVMETARRRGAPLLPIDSEISAVFQCMQGVKPEWVERIILTASGGPFVDWPKERLAGVTAEQALAHPNWAMGPKVTVDSATLMNKGFEVFELRWLFDMPVEKIEVVVHHQSIIHSAVQLTDSSILAQMSLPDMQGPIQYALTYPERRANSLPRLELASRGELTFDRPDVGRFPCLRLAYDAAAAGGTYPAVLNAADEVAVEAFLEGRLGFLGIPEVLERVLERHDAQPDDLEAVLAADRWARERARAEVAARGDG